MKKEQLGPVVGERVGCMRGVSGEVVEELSNVGIGGERVGRQRQDLHEHKLRVLRALGGLGGHESVDGGRVGPLVEAVAPGDVIGHVHLRA